MSKNYHQLQKAVELRSNPELFKMKSLYAEENVTSKLFESKNLINSDVYQYIKKSMRGVAQEYTNNSKVAANQVEAHLNKSHGLDVHFERQGSVMTNTHILKDNDIDLVQITNKSKGVDRIKLKQTLSNPSLLQPSEFSNLKNHSENFSQYQGNQLSDLRDIRKKSENVLDSTYKTVDITKDNSIYVLVSSPERDVDVVTATYYKGIDYMKTNRKHRRGIQIYNKTSNTLSDVDYPFWSIQRINERSIITNGRFKNMIRFLKNVKYDCENIDKKGAIRSFHINAICYNINNREYEYVHFLELLPVLIKELDLILNEKSYRDSIKSVDGTETIFEKDCVNKLKEIKFLRDEIIQIVADLYLSNQQLK